MSQMLRSWIIGSALLALAVSARSAAAPTNPVARVTTGYIDTKCSLNYPDFEGLSVDSLGKEHFPLVTMEPPPKPWRPLKVKREGSRVEYRGTNAAPWEPPRWAIEIDTNEILLESHWSADDAPQPLVLNADTKKAGRPRVLPITRWRRFTICAGSKMAIESCFRCWSLSPMEIFKAGVRTV